MLHAKQAGAGDTDVDGDSVTVAELETDAVDVETNICAKKIKATVANM